MRLEPPIPHYSLFHISDMPYRFNVSQLTEIELPPEGTNERWINIAYPLLNSKIYCSYIPITPATLSQVEEESRELVLRQAKRTEVISEKAYSNPEAEVYARLFLLDGESASPIQFMLTDSSTRFFRGSLLYNSRPNVDSLAPVTGYLQEEIMEIIQSFRWN